MKKIILTGANGQLGRALIKAFNINKYKIYPTDVDSLDICNYEAVCEYFHDIKPYAVINCAAYTNVDGAEENKEICEKVNTLGAKNLAICAKNINAKIVHISTDYVFDGTMGKPYTEEDETCPINVYGITKRDGENEVIKENEKHFILRTAWLYGEGKNFVKTMLELAKTNSELKVVNDQHGTPTSAKCLAECILSLLETDYYGIYHATNEGECTWYEFCVEIMKQTNNDIKVIPVTSDEFVRPAKRPKYSVLENKRLKELNIYEFKNWQDALKEYLKTLA